MLKPDATLNDDPITIAFWSARMQEKARRQRKPILVKRYGSIVTTMLAWWA